MKIGELAKATGTSVENIRFYEREALLPAPRRTENNYRFYGEEHIERLGAVAACPMLEPVDGRLQLCGAAVGEAGDAKVAVLAGEPFGLDAHQLDMRTPDGELQQRRRAGASHGQADRAACRSAHVLERRVDIGRIDRRVVDLHDHVAGTQPGALGGRAGHAPHHADAVLGGADLHADARVRTAGGDLHVLELVVAQEGGVRVERFGHAADGGEHQLMGTDRIDVIGLYALHHAGKQLRILHRHRGVGQRRPCLLVAVGQHAAGKRQRHTKQ